MPSRSCNNFSQCLPRTHAALLIIVQRPKKISRLEYIKCLPKKDFMRLVTSKNNLNFNSQGRIFFKTIKCCLWDHMDSISDGLPGPELSCQILLHMWNHLSNMHHGFFSFFFSLFIPSSFFFKQNKTKNLRYMENEITFPSGKKDLALRLKTAFFKEKKVIYV